MKGFITAFIFIILTFQLANALNVTYTQGQSCGTSTLTATFTGCSFSGFVTLTTSSPGVTFSPTNLMAVTNGVGTISMTLSNTSTNPFTLNAKVVTISVNPGGCTAVNDVAANTITHICLPPPVNDNCSAATSCPIYPHTNITITPYYVFNATTSTGFNNCTIPINYKDVFYSFVANNDTVKCQFGTFPATSLLYSLHANCATNTYLQCGLQNENTTVNLLNLTIGTTYIIRIQVIGLNNEDLNMGLYSTTAGSVGNPAPVLLKSFDIKDQSEEAVTLAWETALEVNFKHFYVEKSVTNTDDFTVIGMVDAAAPEGGKYTFNDTWVSTSPKVYYRLKMVDYDESYEYSKTISLSPNVKSKLVIHPVPTNDMLNVVIPQDWNDLGMLNFQILSMDGRVVRSLSKPNNLVQEIQFDVNDLPSGQYILKILSPSFSDAYMWVKN